MPLHRILRDLVHTVGPAAMDDADALRGLLDDYFADSDASPAEIAMLVEAVRSGALARLVDLISHHALPDQALDIAGALLSDTTGTDRAGARWAVSSLGFGLGVIDEAHVETAHLDWTSDKASRPRSAIAPSPAPLPPSPPPPSVRPAAVPAGVTQPTPSTVLQPDQGGSGAIPQPASDSDATPRPGRRFAAVIALLVGAGLLGGWLVWGPDPLGGSRDDTDATRDTTSSELPTTQTSDGATDSGAGDRETPAMTVDTFVAVASRSGGGRVVVIDTMTGSRRELRSPHPATQPSVSADGQTVAFVAETADGPRLAISVGEAAPRILDVGRSPEDPAISPDGKSVAYVVETSGGKDVALLHLDESSPLTIAALSSNEFAPAWSFNGALISYIRSGSTNDSIIAVDAATGVESASASILGHARSAALSPDGTEVAYVAVVQGNADVLITSLQGSETARNLSQSPETETTVLWLGTGDLVTSAPSRGLTLINPTTRTSSTLTAAAGDGL